MNDTHAQNLMSMSRARVVAPNDRYQSVRLLQHSIRYGDSVFVDKWLFRTESYGGTVEERFRRLQQSSSADLDW